ncbi:polyphosphate:AMP phosphotransferase [Oceanibacterium hippocampi]|uniref:Thymidylate kinase n=1 Tax=Oceanibacterium hippocampi TaxID=745714 RepID=A0A1Y5R815_9PROT|nr:polyphosphate:AMP phosphotransferase [Oceanibacterium hippocampi]SLN11268.1 Thymidylate kinase [Oceanibacterium hippocampi]
MFEVAEQKHSLNKEAYREAVETLRFDLLSRQLELAEKRDFSVIVVVSGVDGAGKGEAIHSLFEWMDPKHMKAHAFGEPTEEQRMHPRMWRYWHAVPPKGEIAVVFGSWYFDPMRARVLGERDAASFDRELGAINRFEAMLASEGVLILKLWFHLSLEQQKKRLAAIARKPSPGLHVLAEWSGVANHAAVNETSETVIRRTNAAHAPWIVVPSADGHYRDVMLGRTIADAIGERMAGKEPARPEAVSMTAPSIDGRTILDSLDLGKSLDKSSYERQLARYQHRLFKLAEKGAFDGRAVVTVFEGWDAAGKGGAIRRIVRALDPRMVRMFPISAPSEEELAHPYLWRFWRRLPRHGQLSVFDRSWYGRVLVERVEGFCDEADWQRAYTEINDFETQLADDNYLVLKFWLHISKDEQLKRFKAREQTPFKQYKITDDDWRNRRQWDAYAVAANDMIERTSTRAAPWTLIEAEDKRHARVKVLKTLCKRLESVL